MSEIRADVAEPASPGRSGARIAAAAVALLALVVLGRSAGDAVVRFAEWVQGLGAIGPAVFIAGYAAAVVGFVPGSILTLGAGAVFGVRAGTVYVLLAASIGACLAFLVARHAARDSIARRLRDNERFAAIDRAVGSEGRKIVFLLRLSPVFPFNLLNYALGLTGVRFADYAIACIGMLPGTLLYVYLGSAIGNLAGIAAGESGASAAAERWIFFSGLLVTAVVTVLITRIARRALDAATREGAA